MSTCCALSNYVSMVLSMSSARSSEFLSICFKYCLLFSNDLSLLCRENEAIVLFYAMPSSFHIITSIILHSLSSQCQRIIPSPDSGLHLFPISQGPFSFISSTPFGLLISSYQQLIMLKSSSSLKNKIKPQFLSAIISSLSPSGQLDLLNIFPLSFLFFFLSLSFSLYFPSPAHLCRPKFTSVWLPLQLSHWNSSDQANANHSLAKFIGLKQVSLHSLYHLIQILSCPAFQDTILSRWFFFCSLLVSFTGSFFSFHFLCRSSTHLF